MILQNSSTSELEILKNLFYAASRTFAKVTGFVDKALPFWGGFALAGILLFPIPAVERPSITLAPYLVQAASFPE